MHSKVYALIERDGLVLSREHPELASALKRACHEGSLVRLQPGVFADPACVTSALRLTALCRSVPHGVLHGRTAAALWLQEPVGAPLELAVRSTIAQRREVTATIRTIPAEEVRRYNDLAVASPAYSAAELAGVDDGGVATRMLREGLTSVEALLRAGRALTGTAGNACRLRVLSALAANPWSHAERVLHELLGAAGIHGWVANHGLRLEGRWVIPDILFEEQRLVLEVDGYAHHNSIEDWRRDLDRQNVLVSADYRVLRFTWDDLTNKPTKVVRRIRLALS
ncbi:MAG: endonuclease domain-containing protein [Propionicimonas sp.]